MPKIMPKTMLAAALSTGQELVNALGLIQLRREYDIQFSRIDSLQTETAAKNKWSQRLKNFIKSREYGTHRDVPFGFEDASHEYHPDRITENLMDDYNTQKSPIAWLYSGGQKAQAIGLFQTFKARIAEGHVDDIAVSLETSQGRQQLHLLCVENGKLIHQIHDTTVDLSVAEYALLFGQTFQEPAGYQIWPKMEQKWDDRHPEKTPKHNNMTWLFCHDEDFRDEIKRWPKKGKVKMVNSPKGSPEYIDQPYTSFFEYAVTERLHHFLKTHKHNVIEARGNCFRQSSPSTKVEYDILLTLRSGKLIAFDAKSGKGSSSYRKQKRGVEEIGGWSAQLYYISPWFPKYLNVNNCDDHKRPWNPYLTSEKSGGPRFFDERSEIRKIYESWRSTDEIFGREWNPKEEQIGQFGHRPPDYREHPQFHSSLLIPFDACEDQTESLFEARLTHLLCR